MSLAITYSRACVGIDAPLVNVETHLSNGLPAFNLVGLAETAVRESKERVRSAIINSGFEFPLRRITVNLAPADIPKHGTRYDLAIALGILAATEQIPRDSVHELECFGELALGGKLRAVGGILPAALAARSTDRKFVLADDDAFEASLVEDLDIYQATELRSVCEHLIGTKPIAPFEPDQQPSSLQNPPLDQPDFADVQGQHGAKRALEIAAAGSHNLLMVGPPGSGKTMLATRLPGILPPLSKQQAFESAKIWSVAERGFSSQRWRTRPFRAPHHTSSPAAIIGGGTVPKPGEVSLAHHGVLFLDELPHFDRRVLEVLREPMEAHSVTISRAAFCNDFPANFQLIAALNPCPCGYYGDPSGRCICRIDQIERYLQKISGPLLDRIDLQVAVPRPQNWSVANDPQAEASSLIAARVSAARCKQHKRQNKLNRLLSAKELTRVSALTPTCREFIENAFEKFAMSARSLIRVLKVARTIADLEDCTDIEQQHLAEALSLRAFERMISDLRGRA